MAWPVLLSSHRVCSADLLLDVTSFKYYNLQCHAHNAEVFTDGRHSAPGASKWPGAGAEAGAHDGSGPGPARRACLLGRAPALLQGVVRVQVAHHGRVLRRVPGPPALTTGTTVDARPTKGALAAWAVDLLISSSGTPRDCDSSQMSSSCCCCVRPHARHWYGVYGGILSYMYDKEYGLYIATQARINLQSMERLYCKNACRDKVLTQTQGLPRPQRCLM